MKKWLLVLIIAVVSQAQVSAQEPPRVDIPGSQVVKITSNIVAGQEYELDILLPSGYQSSNKKYPVLYLMDSQWDFPLAKSLYGQHYFDGFIPEMIIVGITWGGKNPNPDSLRARDYTPTNEKRLKQSGGAENFLSFIRKELFPYVETKYKADTTDRILIGCSLGGLFTMYTLFTHPDMFKSYIAASPAFGWDKEVLYQYEKKYFDSKPSLPAKLYITIGEVEKGVAGFDKLVKQIASRNYRNLKFRSKVLENTGHSGTKTEGFGRGLQFVYERPTLHPQVNQLNKFTGRYEIDQNNIIEIQLENYGLICLLNNTRYPLFAATETDYYATSEFFNIHFPAGDDKAPQLTLERYGRTDLAKRVEIVPEKSALKIISNQ